MIFTEMVEKELKRARTLHEPWHSAHEGWAILYEEVDELWDEVRRKAGGNRDDRMLHEIVQIGAMAQRFAEDVLGVDQPAPHTGAGG